MQFFQHKQSKIAYHTFGTGSQLLFAFHGYADTGRIFEKLTVFKNKYTIIAIDFPFHGATDWQEDTMHHDWLEAFLSFILKSFKTQQYALLGTSMGARLVLHIFNNYPSQVTKIYLLAPDGIALHPLHTLMMRLPTSWLGTIENWFKNPNGWLAIAGFLYKIRIVNKAHFIFLKRSLQDEERRKRLFGTWKLLPFLTYEKAAILKKIDQYGIQTLIFYGLQDKTFPSSSLLRFSQRSDFITIIPIPAGHDLIRDGKINTLDIK